jgi:ATP-dependent Lon protease
MDKLAEFVRRDLSDALAKDEIHNREATLAEKAKQDLEKIIAPFRVKLKEAGLALVSFQVGPIVQTAIFPVIDGQPVPPEQFEKLHDEGKITEEQYQAFHTQFESYEAQLAEIDERASEIHHSHMEESQEILEGSIRWIMGQMVSKIAAEFPNPSLHEYLKELVDDLVIRRLSEPDQDFDFTQLYRVNVVLDHQGKEKCPIIVESAPTMRNLLGSVEYDFERGEPRSSHMGIRPGSLLQADGGFLIIEARDVLSESEAWKVLVRTLRTGQLEIVPSDKDYLMAPPLLKPVPIEVNIKVVLVGEAETYYLLDALDPDFPQLFKVLADFDTVLPRDATGVLSYAQVLARIVQDEKLLHFDSSGVAALVEHGARIAASRGKLSTRFGRLADIAREASFLSQKKDYQVVTGDNVREAVRFGKKRADLPARRFRELVADGTLKVQVKGATVGQVNGLAIMQAGPMVYGFPARVTATIGPGTAGVINIEREANLSGAIHTKGFYILGGLLRSLLRTNHPLAFDASVAFEQSYGGIDGDSASGAEVCCLLSALTEIPLSQELAMTGAIDQMGSVLAVGGVNEKVEGFYDTCHDLGLTGTQGVIIPKANAGDLMLRHDVVESCAANRFRIFSVETVQQALEILTGSPAGTRDKEGAYPDGSVLGVAVRQARRYWEMAAGAPGRPVQKKQWD